MGVVTSHVTSHVITFSLPLSPPLPVAGRGIGCGRIPDYRLLMDQLVPASYLQLEDTVRNAAIQMRIRGKPPVLTYKELRWVMS